MRSWVQAMLAGGVILAMTARLDGEVVITEIMAKNTVTLADSIGVYDDWVELYNDGDEEVDLSGWGLTDKRSKPFKYTFPDGVTIGSNSYLIVYCADTAFVTNGQVHCNLGFSDSGEAVYLTKRGASAPHSGFDFPAQIMDVSYGYARPSRTLVDENTVATYRIGGTGTTYEAIGSIGVLSTNEGFICRQWDLNVAIDNVAAAEAAILDSSKWNTDRAYPIVKRHRTINFQDTNCEDAFQYGNAPFPGNEAVGDAKDHFVVVCEGDIYIPSAGAWTFCVASDDGFSLTLTGGGRTFTSSYNTGRSFNSTLSTFQIPSAGVYSVRLLYYENSGGAACEFSAAKGTYTTFLPSVFHLVGSPESQLVQVPSSLSDPYVTTDIREHVTGKSARVDVSWGFWLDSLPPTNDTAKLTIRYAHGYEARLNGNLLKLVANPNENTPDAVAQSARSPYSISAVTTVNVPINKFKIGANTLTFILYNESVTNECFFLQPNLSTLSAEEQLCFFKEPTPGEENTTRGYQGPTPEVTIDQPHGYRTEPFTVSISCPSAPRSEIYYTLDGSEPSTVNGTRYTEPISVSSTTILRACVPNPDTVRATIATRTWLFLDDILQQSSDTPAGWPAGETINGQKMEYGMRSEIVNGDRERLANGITNAESVATISIVTDIANLLDPKTGIYVNPANSGIAWERPVSVEQIDPVHGSVNEFQIDAGLRIRGAYSRKKANPKHSFRLFFRGSYGQGSLDFPLFGDEGTDSFKKVDLRTAQNYSWGGENSAQNIMCREVFSRDSQRDMGMPYTRSRYYHLFLNGVYWGLYQTQERADDNYAASYMGGENDDWDVIKTANENGSYFTEAAEGTFDMFYALADIAIQEGFTGAHADNYWRVQGLNPDGTPNPNYPKYVNVDNLIVYMLLTHYVGDSDSPISASKFPNNMYGLINRVTPDGFIWLRHDAEHSLGVRSGYPVTDVSTLTWGTDSSYETYAKFNPSYLHAKLMQHPVYRMRFADTVQKACYGDGPMSPENAKARFRARMQEIDLAIIGESARWGRGKTRDNEWLTACNYVLDTYLTQRRDILIAGYQSLGWFPSVAAPQASQYTGFVDANTAVSVFASTNFYYTLNGEDPRASDGSVNAQAISVVPANAENYPDVNLFSPSNTWSYYDAGSEPAANNGVTWKDLSFNDSVWGSGPGILGVSGNNGNVVGTATKRYVNGDSGTQVTTTYFRKRFTINQTTAQSDKLLITVLFDDGYVLYLNGVEIDRNNMPSGTITYETFSSSTIGNPAQKTYYSRTLVLPAGLLQEGENVFAAEVHQCHGTSTDMYFDLGVTASLECLRRASVSLPVQQELHALARAYGNGEWSALTEVRVMVNYPEPAYYQGLRVSEFMYAPVKPAGTSHKKPEFSWVEFRNTGAEAIDIGGVTFTASTFNATFGSRVIQPGERFILSKSIDAFAELYPTNGLAIFEWTGDKFAKNGELLALATPQGTNILSFTFSSSWYPEANEGGSSLVALDLHAAEPLWSTKANWRASGEANGTPGTVEHPHIAAAALQLTQGTFTFTVENLENPPTVWVCDDLATQNWQRCPDTVLQIEGNTVTVNLNAANFPALQGNARFFRIKQ